MRLLWVLGCVGMISTANAQPAPAPDVPPDTVPSPPADTVPSSPADTAPAPPADTAPSPPADTVPAPAPSTAPAPPLAPPSAVPPRTAPGATAPAAVDPEAEPERESYGWQIAIADAASTVLIFKAHDQSATTAGLLTYALGGPIIHGAHEQGGRALASLALRIGLPVASAWLWGRCSSNDDDCDNEGAVAIGALLGFATAMVIDATALSHPVKVRKPASVTWVPQISATRQQAGLGVLGQF